VARVSSEDAADLKINWGSGAGEPQIETLDSSDLEAIGSKLSSESGSTLLITSTLYTFDGDEAGMFVGQEVPLESVQSQRNCLPESSVVSTDLTVNTDIDSEAKILLDVALEISTVASADAVEVQEPTNDCPPIFTEHIRTKVKGSDGDIVVLSKPAKGDDNSPRLMLFLKPKIGFRSTSDKLPSIEELIKADKIVTLSD
jgi:type II secretory pathway component GspD/PulD (secretin)